MSFTYSELVYRIVSDAQRGSQAAQLANIDTQGIAESLIPSIFQQAAEEAAADESKRTLLKRSATLTFTDGVATVPSYVLTAYIKDATLINADDLSVKYSLVINWSDFIDPALRNPPWSGYGYYSLPYQHTMNLTEPGVAYDPNSGASGDRLLNIPCVTEIPADADGVVVADDEIINDILDIGAAALRGEIMKVVAREQT